VLTLSKQGNKDIYSYSLANKKLTRLTQHKGIDTEASYSPDGKNLVFTSDFCHLGANWVMRQYHQNGVVFQSFYARMDTK
jgi:dipeptidyl aminopeptidase/acylaminoacyl peptidase